MLWHLSPPVHEQNIVHGICRREQPQLPPLQDWADPQQHLIIFNNKSGAACTSSGRGRGISILLTWSASNPCSNGFSSGGQISKAVYQWQSWKWALRTFKVKASVVGGNEQSFGAEEIDFLVLIAHCFWRHSVIDLQGVDAKHFTKKSVHSLKTSSTVASKTCNTMWKRGQC